MECVHLYTHKTIMNISSHMLLSFLNNYQLYCKDFSSLQVLLLIGEDGAAGDSKDKGDPGVCGPPGRPGDDTVCMLGRESDNVTSELV